jgi:uncharacterized protein (TIGR03067 family)
MLTRSTANALAAMLMSAAAWAQTPPVRTELEGAWIAQSIERDGKAVAADIVARTRYTFAGARLLVRGNYANDREDEFAVAVDASDVPKYLDLTDANGYPTAGIYERNGDVLIICLGRAERPAECKAGQPRVTRIVLKRVQSTRMTSTGLTRIARSAG